MAEVKKSYFVAINTEQDASEIAGDTFTNTLPSSATDAREAFVLEPSGLPDLALDFEEVTRDVIRNSYLPAAPMRGVINTTSSMTFELHGGGMAGAYLRKPDYHPALYSAFGGVKYQDTVVTNGVTLTATAFTGGVSVGEVITGQEVTGIAPTATAGDVRVFKDTVGGGYVVIQHTGTATGLIMAHKGVIDASPTWNVAPSSAYWMPNSVSDIPKFAFVYYRANIVREIYARLGVTSCEFPFKAGEIVLPVFNFNVADGDVSAQDYLSDGIFPNHETTVSSTQAGPLFAKAVDWGLYVMDTTQTDPWDSLVDLTNSTDRKIVDAFTLRLTNEQNTQKDITAAQGIAGYAISNRSVELTLSAYYDDVTTNFATENLSKLFIDPSNRYRLTVSAFTGSSAGNMVFMFAPRVGFKTKVTEENGLFKYDVTGSAEYDAKFGENALTVVFF